MESARPVAGATVVIEGNGIRDVGTAVQTPAGARVIDGTGKFLIPGMIDAHVHLRGGRGSQPAADPRPPGG
jgi:imidazolonepropionase-like amidohydrolase